MKMPLYISVIIVKSFSFGGVGRREDMYNISFKREINFVLQFILGGRPKNHPVMEAAEKEVQDRTILFRNVRM